MLVRLRSREDVVETWSMKGFEIAGFSIRIRVIINVNQCGVFRWDCKALSK